MCQEVWQLQSSHHVHFVKLTDNSTNLQTKPHGL